MSRFAFLLLCAFFASSARAQQAAFYLGGGFGAGAQTLKGEGSAASKFSGAGWVTEAGIDWPRFHLGVEYGATDIQNQSKNQAFIEAGNLKFFAGKAAVHFGKVAVGAGYRHGQVSLKSLSSTGAGYLESKYEGWTPLGFASVNFDSSKRLRTSIETQYVTGRLTSEKNSLPAASFGEIALSLRIYILID